MVQPARAARRPGGLRAGARLHDRQALRLGAVGEHPSRRSTGASRPPATSTPRSRCFIPKSFLEKEKQHVEGFAPELAVVTIGGGRGAGRAAGRAADVGDDHRPRVRAVDQVVPRSARAHQSVEQRGPLGASHQALSPHARVLVAGGPHRPRDLRRGRGRNAPDARRVRRLRRERGGGAGDPAA